MDLEDDRASIMAEAEDRISNLPDDIIHRILSFLDMKYVVQTSTLSRKWKLIWTSVPGLHLNSQRFRTLPMFAKFVKHVLARRSNLAEVSEVKLFFTGAVTQFFFRSILNYAYLHNVRQLTIMYFAKKDLQFPHCLFSSHTLKHLTISNRIFHPDSPCLPNSAWNFPALETLVLDNMKISNGTYTSLDLFSKCVNLKNLTLNQFLFLGVEVFNICAPELSNLTITEPIVFPKVFNVVAPQLESLTAYVSCEKNPFFREQQCRCCENNAVATEAHRTLQLSTDSFKYLDKVNLSVSFRCKAYGVVPIQPDLFQKLRSTKSLTLNVDIVEALSCMDDLLHQPCPFDNLKCLKIRKQYDRKATLPTQVRNYLLGNSPNAHVILELPQPPPKRSREQDDPKAKKISKTKHLAALKKLEAQRQELDKLVAYTKTMLKIIESRHQELTLKMANQPLDANSADARKCAEYEEAMTSLRAHINTSWLDDGSPAENTATSSSAATVVAPSENAHE